MQLSWKENLFSAFFSAFLKSSLNFEHFQEKDDPDSWCISEIIDSEVRAEINVYKVRLRGSFEKQHGKGAQTLLKFDSTFTIFIDQCERNWSTKGLS